MPVSWPDEVERILGGDLTAALAYVTPAGGSVVTAVAPVGLRNRDEGTVTFTTSLGLGKKLERIKSDPHVALACRCRRGPHGGRREERQAGARSHQVCHSPAIAATCRWSVPQQPPSTFTRGNAA